MFTLTVFAMHAADDRKNLQKSEELTKATEEQADRDAQYLKSFLSASQIKELEWVRRNTIISAENISKVASTIRQNYKWEIALRCAQNSRYFKDKAQRKVWLSLVPGEFSLSSREIENYMHE